MRWQVAYWDDQLWVVTSDDCSWESLPVDGVVWVQVGGHRMQGMDRYWVDERTGRYGNYIVDKSQYDHDGPYELAWGPEGIRERMLRKVGAHRKANLPPAGVHVLRGTWLPDDLARKLGVVL